ncbi:MAG: SGNH/GDSL hydrolase family protein, partial [Chloroflexi bacterium]|nr:SGNH/GDSL hydrolase family protein [Chloroflexota bacterium]
MARPERSREEIAERLHELQKDLDGQSKCRRLNANDSRPVTYVAVGASDAVGVGASAPDLGYVQLLSTLLRAHFAPQRELVSLNYGIPGLTTPELARELAPRLSTVCADIATIWVGANDILQGVETGQFAGALQLFLRALCACNCHVFVGSIPDLSLTPAITALPTWLIPLSTPVDYVRRRKQELTEVVLRLTAIYGAHYVALPMGRVLADPSLVSADGFHPSDAGYRELARRWWSAISS